MDGEKMSPLAASFAVGAHSRPPSLSRWAPGAMVDFCSPVELTPPQLPQVDIMRFTSPVRAISTVSCRWHYHFISPISRKIRSFSQPTELQQAIPARERAIFSIRCDQIPPTEAD